MGFACHVADALAQTCVAKGDGGIAALFQAGAGAVLPKDRRCIGQGAHEAVVAAHESPVAQIQTLIKNFPEAFDITAGGKGHVYQVQGNDALVEPAVELVVAVLILPRT